MIPCDRTTAHNNDTHEEEERQAPESVSESALCRNIDETTRVQVLERGLDFREVLGKTARPQLDALVGPDGRSTITTTNRNMT